LLRISPPIGEDEGMMERRQIVDFWVREPAGLLVTLVRAEGSSYRRPGARLVAAAKANTYAGTISGGCLETDVVKKAAWRTRNGAVVERYSMSFDDTAEIPFGLGCGGTVDLLFESLATPEGVALMQALSASLAGRESTVVSFLPDGTRPLRRLIVGADGEIVFASPSLSAEKISCARALEPGGEYEGRFVERLSAPQRLIILGAGDDARPVAQMAALQGWTIVVADGRARLARPERFPEAEQVITLQPDVPLDIRPTDAVVLMTHSYEQDRELLVRILPLTPRYLGLLGSRHRSSLLVSEAAALTGRTVDSCCDRLFAPIGMDLGGDGPQAIALAIVAEVQSVCEKRSPVTRRLTPEEIERQLAKGGTSRYLSTQCALNAG
jgi:xanthine dehydrogenase accessory factor